MNCILFKVFTVNMRLSFGKCLGTTVLAIVWDRNCKLTIAIQTYHFTHQETLSSE